jgi:glutamine synthetase
VGFIRTEEAELSQQEIEFLPSPAGEAADQLAVGKWILSSIGHKYGVSISFAPKIYMGHAGSGLHFHTALVKNGRNCMIEKGGISPQAKKLIAGFLSQAKPLTAFGNTVPTSYFRLVPHQEAPISVCWGYHNRSALIRIPLGWLNAGDMIRHANPLAAKHAAAAGHSQTVEFRSADGSANVHLFLAGLCVAARLGFEMKDPLEYMRGLFVDKNISGPGRVAPAKPLPKLPSSCFDSALELANARGSYEAKGVFPPAVIDGLIKRLKNYGDRNLSERLYGKEDEIKKLVDEFLYC